MSKVTINGVTIAGDFSGRSIVVRNNEVFIDGVSQDLPDVKNIVVEVHGDVESVETASASINVTGNVHNVDSTSGSITIGGFVSGDVETTSGNVKVNGGISGRVSTVSGSVKHK